MKKAKKAATKPAPAAPVVVELERLSDVIGGGDIQARAFGAGKYGSG